MGLRHWSGRRIGAMWTAVVVIEAAVAAVSAYQSRDIRAEMRKTERELHGNFADSLRDTRSGGLILHRTNPRADSLQDSVVKLLNRVFADSGVQGTLWAAANRASQAILPALGNDNRVLPEFRCSEGFRPSRLMLRGPY